MNRRTLEALLLAFSVSATLNEPLHRSGVPELARYSTGGALLIIVAWVLFEDSDLLQKLIVVCAIAGFGVGVNRLRVALA